MSIIAKNLERFRQAARAHDEINPDHSPAYGVCVSHFDLERMGFDEGEELWPGFTIHADAGCTGNFRIICDFDRPREVASVEAVGSLA